MSELSSEQELKRLYEETKTIAVVGAHPDPDKPAHYVPAYLHQQGYKIIPVNPNYTDHRLWGEPVRGSLDELEEAVEVVDIFRRSTALPQHLEELLTMDPGPEVVWFQQGIRNDEVAQRLSEAGIDVVQDRCMYATHRSLYGR